MCCAQYALEVNHTVLVAVTEHTIIEYLKSSRFALLSTFIGQSDSIVDLNGSAVLKTLFSENITFSAVENNNKKFYFK